MRGSTMDGDELDAILISIHASTWEAAKKPVALPTKQTHFNSRLYMRGSRSPLRWAAIRPYFNSRLYMRGSACGRATLDAGGGISIHASTWEAAYNTCTPKLQQVLFQFTPLHERQPASRGSSTAVFHFNSRLYMRGSCWLSRCCKAVSYFNSRLYMRGSGVAFQNVLHFIISIHASTWEAAKFVLAFFRCSLFQFTPLHERQLQKYTIFSIKSTQFSTKPCFFIVTSRKVVLFSIPVQYFL